jgi:GNAT superfamily N-acetyltransferase
MRDVQISIASVAEHAALTEYYLQWGYRGGIADDGRVYVARRDRSPVGLVRRASLAGHMMLRGMQVAPDCQRQGVGTELLRAFVADLPPAGCYSIPFAHLVAFYGQGGFAPVAEAVAPPSLRERLSHYRAEGHDVLLMYRPACDSLDRAEVSLPPTGAR